MTMQEEDLHAGGKWETMNFLGVALDAFLDMCDNHDNVLFSMIPR